MAVLYDGGWNNGVHCIITESAHRAYQARMARWHELERKARDEVGYVDLWAEVSKTHPAPRYGHATFVAQSDLEARPNYGMDRLWLGSHETLALWLEGHELRSPSDSGSIYIPFSNGTTIANDEWDYAMSFQSVVAMFELAADFPFGSLESWEIAGLTFREVMDRTYQISVRRDAVTASAG